MKIRLCHCCKMPLKMDNTGTYCENTKCSEFWDTKEFPEEKPVAISDKYDQHVREVAEEMAKDQFTDFEERSAVQQERYVAYFSGAARIAVRREAEEVIRVLNLSYLNHIIDFNLINQILIERGLIPAPEWNVYPGKSSGC